jgi:hypothetical protein
MTPTRVVITASRGPEPAALQSKNQKGDDPGEETGGKERDAKEQVEAESGPEELCKIGGHGNDLGENPQSQHHRRSEAVPYQLGEVPAGSDPKLGRQRLDEHRGEVRSYDAPEQ